jgi:hypothetical protein
MNHTTRWAVAALAVTTVALSTVACTTDAQVLALDSVGHVDGSTALVALVAADEDVTAYVCDGDGGIGERFTGTARGGHADLRSDAGAALSVDLRRGAAEGTFTPAGGTPQHFVTTPAATDEAGFFTADGAGFTAGWVELNDGTQNGIAGEDDGHGGKHRKRAPRLVHHRRPANGNPGGVIVETRPGGAKQPANGNPGIVPPSGDPQTALGENRPPIVKVPVEDGGALPPRAIGAGNPLPVVTQPPRVRGDGGTLAGGGGDIAPLKKVAGTVDAPTASIEGIGDVTPHRVGVTDLLRRR